MRPNPCDPKPPDDLFRSRLGRQIDPRHPLVRLAGLIDWGVFEDRFGQLDHPHVGRPGIAIRLMVGLSYLQHSFRLSDEEVVARWVENPYWQYFCGFDYLQLELPIDPSALVRWRRRIGQDGIELLLQETIAAAQRSAAVKEQSLERVSVDTTVPPKAIAHPLVSRLYHRGREILMRLAKRHGVPLRQSCTRLGKKALRLASRDAHARQMQRAKREIRRLKTYLGRVFRDVRRKLEARPEVAAHFAEALARIERPLAQQRHDQNKLYPLHAPEVACIAQGKAHKKSEFGEGVGRRHQPRGPGGRQADPRRQSVRRPDPGAGACPGRTPHGGRARALLRRPRLSRPRRKRRHRGVRRRPAARDHAHDQARAAKALGDRGE